MSDHITVRAKFSCWSVSDERVKDQATQEVVKHREIVRLGAVSSPGGGEDMTFWKSTPAGTIDMNIDNKAAFGRFIPGRDYYIDFTLAPLKCKDCLGSGKHWDGKAYSVCARCSGAGVDPTSDV